MKLRFDVSGRHQPDPFIFEDEGKYYLYVTAGSGVEAYSAESVEGTWHFEGVIAGIPGGRNYWAPCIMRIGDAYYIYVSCDTEGTFENLHVIRGESPLGPFTEYRRLYDRFTIDAHAVKTKAGLFLFYAEDNLDVERFGTRVFVDKLIDPMTPAHLRREVIVPTMDEEIYQKNRQGDGRNWHTIEGPFWFSEDGWQYLMYSGGCFENDTYHIGYAAAKTDEEDLTKVDFIKHTASDGGFDPFLFKNEEEEGCGHHSVIKINGRYFAVYHARDRKEKAETHYVEGRTARVCGLTAENGILHAVRF